MTDYYQGNDECRWWMIGWFDGAIGNELDVEWVTHLEASDMYCHGFEAGRTALITSLRAAEHEHGLDWSETTMGHHLQVVEPS